MSARHDHRGTRCLTPGLLVAVLVALLAALLATLLATLLVGAALPSASAAGCYVQLPSGEIDYVCRTDGGGGAGGGGGGSTSGGGGGPSCALAAPATFCLGTGACWYLPSVVPFAPPQGQPPDGDPTHWKVRSCRATDGGVSTGAVWMGGATTPPPPPSLPQQARTAYGRLTPAPGALVANPATTSLVTLPTWFWMAGLPDRLTGSSAFGLVAIARPQGLRVTPGDGSGSFDCPWSTERSDVCSHVYERSSARLGTTQVDGHRAFAASARPVWSVEFELAGVPVTIDGAPTELAGPVTTTAVRVAEVQALVDHVG